MKLQDEDIRKAIMAAMSGQQVAAEKKDGAVTTAIEGVPCTVDALGSVVRAGEGKDQRWFEVHLRDVTPKKFLSPEEQMECEQEHQDWWLVSSVQRACFVRNRSRSGAIEDFLRRFPGEAASGQGMPEAELARGFEFIDDEGDRIRAEFIAKEVMETEAEPPPEPEYPDPGQPAPSTGVHQCAGECTCGGCYPDPTEQPVQDPSTRPNPADFYFGVTVDSVQVCPKEWWDANKCLADASSDSLDSVMPPYLKKVLSYTWAIPLSKFSEDVAIDMVVAGFERNEGLEKFLEQV